ncbi:hypothetical protein P5G65_23500 [Paenibacillus chondroitinus]|uniref:Uncharacterized protein n=1 Tax=Paenibacillus chondroitinus TaxID=59842 RepID=A0ABU6DGI3_9BACL|nr:MULTISPECIES: hypothetical protein [Paenibacillus]MCY9659476.1 hypothetical protein [Paenibacillus anseongense]MEB4796871.1 hypothetical protein [Paenibacillus chondroitinus]
MDNSFYRNLNKERDTRRWLDWDVHRGQIVLLINKAISSQQDVEEALIIGAGNCDDLDLIFLSRIFSKIILMDIDTESLQKGICRLDINLQKQFQLLGGTDLSKLDQIDFYKQFIELLENKSTASKLGLFMKVISEEIINIEILDEWKGQFSTVISSAVYTQIFYIHVLSLFWPYANNYSPEEISDIVEQVRQLRDQIIRSYNDLIMSLAKPGGTVIVWTDALRIDVENPFPEDEFYLLKTEEERVEYLFKMTEAQGRDVAILGLKDLHDKISSQGRHLSSWIWPFSNDKHYITFGLSGWKFVVESNEK